MSDFEFITHRVCPVHARRSPENPKEKEWFSRLVILVIVAGFHCEQSLVHRTMTVKSIGKMDLSRWEKDWLKELRKHRSLIRR